MITEDYVSFETAKLLKEKGFHQPVEFFYSFSGKLGGATPYDWNQTTGDFQDYSCITLWMAMKWLREIHHYYIQIMLDSWAYGGHSGYYVTIQKTNSEFEIMLADKVSKVFYGNPEEAAEAAIKYCLKNLI